MTDVQVLARRRCALLTALCLAAAGCSEEAAGPPAPGELPAPVARAYESWMDAVSLAGAADSAGGPEAGASLAELELRRRELLGAVDRHGGREALLARIEEPLLEAAAGSRGQASKLHLGENLLWLHRRLDGGYELPARVYRAAGAGDFLRLQAADSMARVDPARAREDLLPAMLGEEPGPARWRGQLLASLLGHGVPRPAELVARLLEASPHEQVQIKAAFLARQLADPVLLGPLEEAAREAAFPYTRINAAQSLAQLVGPPAEPFFQELLDGLPADLPPESRRILEGGLKVALEEARGASPGPLAPDWPP